MLADIVLVNDDELNLNLPKFARHVYFFLSHKAFLAILQIFLGENSQHFCILTFSPQLVIGLGIWVFEQA